MKRFFIIVLILLHATGCMKIPFREAARVPMASQDARKIARRFKERMPVNFQLLSTLVFLYNWSQFSGIGYLDINAEKRAFKALCVNPMGVKLFELSGDEHGVVTHFALDTLTSRGDLARAVGQDIRRIYFNLVPSPDATVRRKKYQIIFSHPLEAGRVEHVFAGPGGELVEKRYYRAGTMDWRISYYEYQKQDGKSYPRGIVMKNYRYGYRLLIKQKELYF